MARHVEGNRSEDYNRLASALEEIAGKVGLYANNCPASTQPAYSIRCNEANGCNEENTCNNTQKGSGVSASRLAPPKQALMFEIPSVKKRVRLVDSEGMICGSSIIPYPPGIPLICPGERIEADAISYIQAMRDLGEKVIGVNELGEVIVGANPPEERYV